MGTLLLQNPVGQNGLDYPGLVSETAKVFGLRSRRLKLYLDQDLTQGKKKIWLVVLCFQVSNLKQYDFIFPLRKVAAVEEVFIIYDEESQLDLNCLI